MNTNKPHTKIVVILILLQILLSYSVIVHSDNSPPTLPHRFYGTAKNLDAHNVANGIVVRAMIIDLHDRSKQNFTTTVSSGAYDFDTQIQSEGGHTGDIIYFYINGVNTTQNATFVPGGNTELNLIYPVHDENEENPPGGGNPGGGNENEAPTAKAGGPYTGYVNQSITFNASGSSDDSGVTGYRWDWTNDGTYDTDWLTTKTTTHTYTTVGTFTVKLQVKDSAGLNDTDTASVTVLTSTGQKYPPVAHANGPYTGLTFQNITFDGSGSTDDGTITNYTWDFGDGTTGYGVKPIHSYNRSGLFNITLTVKDDDDLADSNTTTATIIIDSDGDGLSDEIEERLGSDPQNASDVKGIIIEGTTFYLVDTNKDGRSNILYNPLTDEITNITIIDGKLYLDINGDGKWEYIYDPVTGIVTPYILEEKPTGGLLPSWLITLFIILGVAGAIILLIIAILFKTGYLSVEAESVETPEEETAKKLTPPKKK